jgi:hypothetical protein
MLKLYKKLSFLLIELILYIFFFSFVGFYIFFSSNSIITSLNKNYFIKNFSTQYSYFLQEITYWPIQWWDFFSGDDKKLIFKKWNNKRLIICSWWNLILTNVFSGADFKVDKKFDYIRCLTLSWWVVKGGYWIKLNLLIWQEKTLDLAYYFYNWFRM